MTVVPLDRETHFINETDTTENNCVSSFKDGANDCAKPLSGEKEANGDPRQVYDKTVDKEQASCRNLHHKELESKVEKRLDEESIKYKAHMPENDKTIEETKHCVINEGSDLKNVENRSLAICTDKVQVESKAKDQKDELGCALAKVKMPMFPKLHNGNSEVKTRKKSSEKHPESGESDYLTPFHLVRKPLNNYYEIQEPLQQEDSFAIKDEVVQNQVVPKANFGLQNNTNDGAEQNNIVKLHKQLDEKNGDLNAELNRIFQGRVVYGNVSRSDRVGDAYTEDEVSDDDSLKLYTAYNGYRQHEGGSEHIYASLNDDNDDDNAIRIKHEKY